MCKAMEDMRNEAMEKGMQKGMNLFGRLAAVLVSTGRAQDIERVAEDPKYRDQLIREFNLA